MFKFNFKKKKTGEVIAPAHYNQLPNQHQHDYETTEEKVTHEVTDLDEEEQSYALTSLLLAEGETKAEESLPSGQDEKVADVPETNDFGGGSGGGGGAEGDFSNSPGSETKAEDVIMDNLSSEVNASETEKVAAEEVTEPDSELSESNSENASEDVAETVTSETGSDL